MLVTCASRSFLGLDCCRCAGTNSRSPPGETDSWFWWKFWTALPFPRELPPPPPLLRSAWTGSTCNETFLPRLFRTLPPRVGLLPRPLSVELPPLPLLPPLSNVRRMSMVCVCLWGLGPSVTVPLLWQWLSTRSTPPLLFSKPAPRSPRTFCERDRRLHSREAPPALGGCGWMRAWGRGCWDWGLYLGVLLLC